MLQEISLFHLLFILAYLLGLGWYVKYVLDSRKKREELKANGHRSPKHREYREGKRCPECHKMIDRRRTVCQHCGHTFERNPDLEPHPEEVLAQKHSSST